jgi:hypothetical protein
MASFILHLWKNGSFWFSGLIAAGVGSKLPKLGGLKMEGKLINFETKLPDYQRE